MLNRVFPNRHLVFKQRFSAGDYILAPTRAGSYYVLRVLGSVVVCEAVEVDGSVCVTRIVDDQEFVIKSESPLDSRFDVVYCPELVLIGSPQESLAAAREAVHRASRSITEPVVHEVDGQDACLILSKSVIRIDYLR